MDGLRENMLHFMSRFLLLASWPVGGGGDSDIMC